ncbi:MAG: malonic semialdehyde reductase [Xanthomonadales bacterium]|nr:malonic semialdehyde reductase [Xanthomonadales bacterium]
MEQPMSTLDHHALDQLFTAARTHNAWQSKAVDDSLLQQVYDLARMGPTAANCSPARFVFVRSVEGKAKLKPALQAGNLDKTMAAPVTVIVATDFRFYDKLPLLFPHADARSWFVGNEELIQTAGFRNANLQAGYFILAARALGLDAGPMSGFDNAAVDASFFADTGWKSNFLINLGHGDTTGLYPRNPRLPFEEACQLV